MRAIQKLKTSKSPRRNTFLFAIHNTRLPRCSKHDSFKDTSLRRLSKPWKIWLLMPTLNAPRAAFLYRCQLFTFQQTLPLVINVYYTHKNRLWIRRTCHFVHFFSGQIASVFSAATERSLLASTFRRCPRFSSVLAMTMWWLWRPRTTRIVCLLCSKTQVSSSLLSRRENICFGKSIWTRERDERYWNSILAFEFCFGFVFVIECRHI